MTNPSRRTAFLVTTAFAVLVIVLAVVLAPREDTGSGAPRTISRGDLLAVAVGRDDGHVMVFRGGSPGADRAVTPLKCDRAAFAGGAGICLTQDRAFPVVTYAAKFFDARQRVLGSVTVVGFPSRARISPGGRYAATTTFVNGDSYVSPGAFSTRTAIFDVHRRKMLDDLESYQVIRGGKPFRKQDFNFWGVTFDGDDGRFYATLATGEHHYLVRGDVRARRAVVLRDGVECPSLSPDRTRIAFKARVGHPWHWRVHVLDLRTGRETAIPDEHSVDDQVAWLDDRRIAFNRGKTVVSAPADGSAAPTTFLSAANSATIAG